MRASGVPLHLMTTLLFMQTLAHQGMNIDVDAAIRAIRNVPYTLAEASETFLRPYGEPEGDIVPGTANFPRIEE
jgi:hypothetical protein